MFGAFLIVILFMGYLNHRLRYTGLNFGKACVMNISFTDLIWFICHRNTVNPHPMQAHDCLNMVLSLTPNQVFN